MPCWRAGAHRRRLVDEPITPWWASAGCAGRLRQALDEIDLRHVDAGTPTASLSGGERQRIALQGAWLSQADWLVLDEPSNHLDAHQRAPGGADGAARRLAADQP
jgi:ATPase subunit of ABC transporter with duplicated ATPase domains